MADRIPLVTAGTIKDGKIYLRASQDLKEFEQVTIKHKGLTMIVSSLAEISKDQFAWFGIVRALI